MTVKALLLSASLLLPASLKAAAPPRVLGYQLPKRRAPSKAQLGAITQLVDRAGLGSDSPAAKAARAAGRGVLLGAQGLEESPEALARRAQGYDGLDLDLSDVPAAQAARAASFAARLRALLPAPLLLTVAVSPDAAAFAALAEHVDQLTLLSSASIAALERAVGAFERAGAPRAKLALPVWLEGYAELAERLDIKEYDYSDPSYRWDAALGAASREGPRRERMLYENEASIRRKAEFVRRAGLAGLAAWDLGGAARATQPEARRDLLIEALRSGAAGDPAWAPPDLRPGDVVFVDALEDGLDSAAWTKDARGARTRRRFSGVAASVDAAAIAQPCALGVRARARGRYCAALEGGALVVRKALTAGSAERLFDLSARRALKAAGKRRLTLSARDAEGGRVVLEARVDGELLVEAIDDGSVGGAPFLGAGALTLPAGSPQASSVGVVEAVLLDSAQPVAARDATAPVLAGVEARVSAGAVSIHWTTDEPADAQVEYGVSQEYASKTPLDGALGRTHALELPRLELGKSYHYRVRSRDASGNVALSADHTVSLDGGGRYGVAAAEPAPAPTSAPEGVEMLKDDFNRADGLITNEWAEANASSPLAVHSPNWLVTSGSMFVQGNAAWTGVPDGTGPNAGSTNATDSSVFRVVTKRSDFADVAVQFSLLNQGLSTSARTPAQSYDGCHVFLRYRSEYELYYATINRRDNRVTIKKKVPGGPSNGGTYYDLVQWRAHSVPYNAWQQVMATVRDNADGSVTIALYSDGALLIQAVDDGSLGGPALRGAGKVGLRGDNADLKWDDFTVTALPPESSNPAPGGGGAPAPAPGASVGTASNVSLGKLLTASSQAGLGSEPDRANDADTVSRWTSAASDGQWLQADLGVAHELSGATIRWGSNHAKSFEMQVSQDAQNWSLVYSQANGFGGDEAVVFAPTTARFVRLLMTARASSEGYSVRELELAGTPPAGADVSPPQISEIQAAGPAADNATLTVSWTTNEPADSRLDYGPTAFYGESAPEQPALVTRHVMTVTGLVAGRRYHYRIRSRDASGNIGSSGDRVVSIGGAAADPAEDAKASARFLSPALADGYNDKAVFGPAASEVSVVDVRGKRVFRARRSGAPIVWDCRDGAGRVVESGVYIARIVKADSSVVFQSLAVVK